MTAPDFAGRYIKATVDAFDGIGIPVNNAGCTSDDVMLKITGEPWYAILDCHMTAPLRILRRPDAAQDAVDAVYLCCSSESNCITAQTIAVAGNLQ
ncbi:hypothetical protein ACNFBT_21870 [Pseudomonas sp. NY15181]|uniref:hypothetical protein n=1 Tax=Pseudomonas sp. NY15181 TaxID=3400349 RepID=UPI003A8AED49